MNNKEVVSYTPSIGDVVKLKSGGPEMTVRSVSDRVTVMYFDKKEELQTLRFHPECLNVINSIIDYKVIQSIDNNDELTKAGVEAIKSDIDNITDYSIAKEIGSSSDSSNISALDYTGEYSSESLNKSLTKAIQTMLRA